MLVTKEPSEEAVAMMMMVSVSSAIGRSACVTACRSAKGFVACRLVGILFAIIHFLHESLCLLFIAKRQSRKTIL